MNRTDAERRVKVTRLTSIYQRNGYADRKTYLEALADYFSLPFTELCRKSAELGALQDFSGLIDYCKERKAQIDLAFWWEQNDPRESGVTYREGWE